MNRVSRLGDICCANTETRLDIPSIVVESMPGTPPMSSRDIASAGISQSPGSPTPIDIRFSHADYSLSMDISKLQRSSKRGSDYSNVSVDTVRTSYVDSIVFP